jgi:serine/threonine protein kinase
LTSGSFGEIYIATDSSTGGEVALKLEPIRTRFPQLESEATRYHILEGGVGIPAIYWTGRESQFQIMAMERLGESLESLKRRTGKPLSLKTVLMIVDQTLTRVEFVHRRNIVHRDIKPENFLIGQGQNQNLIYLIDFGLSTQFRDFLTGEHIAESAHTSLTGTARYASVGAMKGQKHSRRDDLEALGYIWLYLLKGSLPWQTLPATRGDKKEQILQKKLSITIEDFCEGVPEEFAEYFRVISRLGFEDEPPYAELRHMFRELFVREEFLFDYHYDWLDAPEIVGKQWPKKPVAQGMQTVKPRGASATPSTDRTTMPAPRAKLTITPTPTTIRTLRPLRR